MPKFFTGKENIFDNHVLIKGEDVAHISKVLRMAVDDEIEVCDGCGNDYTVRIKSITKNQIEADIVNQRKNEAEPNVNITLYQALPKQGKMEYIIQKNTELGVVEFVPVYTKRCVVKPSDKIDRWQKVAAEAAKQCGRGIIPTVKKTIDFDEAIGQISCFENKIMLYENEKDLKIKSLISNKKINNIAIFIGPEGGFDDSEVQKACDSGISTVTLGKRILRTETAGAAVVPIIMYEQGDI